MTIAAVAQSGSVISEPSGRPIAARARWNGLMSGVYITFQMMPTTIGGSTIGMRNAVRTRLAEAACRR